VVQAVEHIVRCGERISCPRQLLETRFTTAFTLRQHSDAIGQRFVRAGPYIAPPGLHFSRLGLETARLGLATVTSGLIVYKEGMGFGERGNPTSGCTGALAAETWSYSILGRRRRAR
jgi:hypothetical protein